MPHESKTKRSLILLSLLALPLTGCVTLGSSAPGLLVDQLTGRYSSEDLTPQEKEKLAELIQTTMPEFPPPSEGALDAVEKVNDPELNQWVIDLTVLCRQLDPEC